MLNHATKDQSPGLPKAWTATKERSKVVVCAYDSTGYGPTAPTMVPGRQEGKGVDIMTTYGLHAYVEMHAYLDVGVEMHVDVEMHA